MKPDKKKIYIFLLLLFTGCGRQAEIGFIGPQHKDIFFIEANKFHNVNDAKVFAENLQSKVEKKIYLRSDSSKAGKFYSVCVGDFGSSYSAGEYAFNLFGNEDKSYELIQNGLYAYDEFANILYVGNAGGSPSIYNYNIKMKKTELLWKENHGRVIDFSYKVKAQANFFVTVKSIGRKTIFPFINQIKLYRIIQSTGKIDMIKEFGDAVQLTTNREDDNVIKVTLVSLDERVSTFVNERTAVVNSAGRLMVDQNKTYDLVKENFPVLSRPSIKLSSAISKYSVLDSVFNDKHNFYLRVHSKKHYLFSTTQALNQVEWIDDDYLVLSTLNVNPLNKTIRTRKPNTSNLVIVDLDKKKIMADWTGGGYKNFIVKGKFLYFDNDFGRFSKIYVYNLHGKKMYDTITVKGGCGLQNLPVIPDFE
ncbi:MAG: hypothetical protein C4539_08325 [Ignavibacteriales bacterium]|nr:MAG: hypothetical protein C4539_08325 [Ignavibacteriales bacterium]